MRYIFVIIFSFFAIVVNAQQKSHSKFQKNADNVIDTIFIRSYMDSLATYQAMDISAADTSKEAAIDGKFYRLFTPMTFYHSLAYDAMKISKADVDNNLIQSVINKSLLEIYLTHSELIRNTQKTLDKAGTVDKDATAPMQHEIELSDKIMLLPIEDASSPIDVVIKKPNFWNYKGDYSLQFMQNYISGNWYKGGESSYAILGVVTMEANYNNKQKVKWDNKLELKLGMQNTRTDSIHSLKATEDLIRFTSKLGLQATKHWYYTLQLIAYTQFTHSYKSNDYTVYANFLAPGNINLSLGMDYNVDWLDHHLIGTIHLAPIAYNLKYTRTLELSKRLGIDEGKHALHDLGSQFTVDLTWTFSEILKWKTRLYGYTSYKRAELEWENTFVFQLNKWMSAQLFVYPRFDDGVTRDFHHAYWQFKEFASIGFSYSF